MTMLSTVQYFFKRNGLSVPATVAGSTDSQVTQVAALLEEEGNDLAQRYPWEGITFEATHTTTAAESQGTVASIATNGFRYIKNETIWDRTDQLPVIGPMSGTEWQTLKAVTSNGPRYRYRIRGGLLLVNPAPAANHAWAFEYVSKNWILGADGTTYKQYFTLDTDTMLIPEELLLSGLRWRWKKEKGLDYAEDFRTYEAQISDAMGRDGGKERLNMGVDPTRGPRPGIYVPERGWTP